MLSIQCTRPEVMKVLEACAGVAAKKSTVPITECLLLSTSKQCLQVASTDLMIGIQGSAVALVESPGSVCVKARDLVERLKLLPTDIFQVTARDSDVLIQAGKRKYTLPARDGGDFPALDEVPDVEPMVIPSCSLDALLGGVAKSASEEVDRENINTVFLEWEGYEVRATATDGNVLATCRDKAKDMHRSSALIPLKSALELRGLCKHGSELELRITEKKLFAQCGPLSIAVTLRPGAFMPYKVMIDSVRAVSVNPCVVSSERMLEVLRGLAPSTDWGVCMVLKHGSIEFHATGKDKGSSTDSLDVSYSGPEFRCCFALANLSEAIAGAGSNEVTLMFGKEWSDSLIVQSAATIEASDYVGALAAIREA
jgi:DNA polymerase III subunit beta